jgi:hypothetical protein
MVNKNNNMKWFRKKVKTDVSKETENSVEKLNVEVLQLQKKSEEFKHKIYQEHLKQVEFDKAKEIKLKVVEKPVRTIRPYCSLKLVNQEITIVLNDGSILTKSKVSVEEFNRIRESKTEKEIIKIIEN